MSDADYRDRAQLAALAKTKRCGCCPAIDTRLRRIEERLGLGAPVAPPRDLSAWRVAQQRCAGLLDGAAALIHQAEIPRAKMRAAIAERDRRAQDPMTTREGRLWARAEALLLEVAAPPPTAEDPCED